MTHTSRSFFWIAAALMLGVCAIHPAHAQRTPPDALNLVKNGHFDDETDPLNHWLYVFDHNKHYLNNHKYVSVVEDKASMRKHVMRLDASIHEVCINQGVQVYTAPIRFDPKKKYMISLSARSIGTTGGPGPKCRI